MTEQKQFVPTLLYHRKDHSF